MPRHGNVKRTPKNTVSKSQIENVVKFFRNHAEENVLFMPGSLASKKSIVKLLPSSDTKQGLYDKYKIVSDLSTEEAVGRSLFYKLLKEFCDDIVMMNPRTDLCAICQENFTSHGKLRGKTEDEKAEFFQRCTDHL